MCPPSIHQLTGSWDFKGHARYAFQILREHTWLKKKEQEKKTQSQLCLYTLNNSETEKALHVSRPGALSATIICISKPTQRDPGTVSMIFFMGSQVLHSLEVFLFMKWLIPKVRYTEILQSRSPSVLSYIESHLLIWCTVCTLETQRDLYKSSNLLMMRYFTFTSHFSFPS